MIGIAYRLLKSIYDLVETVGNCYLNQKPRPPLNIKYQRFPVPRASLIPKVLYQTHESEYLPWSIYTPSLQTIYMNPNYKYRFFNADERRAELVDIFGEESRQVAAYDTLRDGTSKSDIFRICILYERGGVYMDCKGATVAPFDVFIPHDSDFAIFLDTYPTRLSTSFISSTPRNAVIEALMEEAVERVLARQFGSNVLDIAGPEMFGTVLRRMLRVDALEVGRYGLDGVTVDIIGSNNLFDSYMHDGIGPLIKRQPDTYMFNLHRLLRRYEFSWIAGLSFQ